MAIAFQVDAFQNNAFQVLAVEIPVEPPPPMVVGGPPRPLRQIPFEQINIRVRGKLLVVRCSLVPGEASGGAKAPGDSVLAVNAIADGASFDVQPWQMFGGSASSRIILTEDEEIMLILADAA